MHIVIEAKMEIYQMNTTLFIGGIMESGGDILGGLAQKYFAQIFATFLLRISTSFEEGCQPSDPMEENSVKQTLWSFE